jgi:hypothetical protein
VLLCIKWLNMHCSCVERSNKGFGHKKYINIINIIRSGNVKWCMVGPNCGCVTSENCPRVLFNTRKGWISEEKYYVISTFVLVNCGVHKNMVLLVPL